MHNDFEKVLENSGVIYLDSNFAMNPGFEEFFNKYEMQLLTQQKKITVCKKVMAELHRLLDDEDDVTRNKAAKAVDIIRRHKVFDFDENLELTQDYVSKAFADNHILSDVVKSITYCNVLVLTCDIKLSRDIINNEDLECCICKELYIYRLNMNGTLEQFDEITNEIEENNNNANDDCEEEIISKGEIAVVSTAGGLLVGAWVYKNKDKIASFFRELSKIVSK